MRGVALIACCVAVALPTARAAPTAMRLRVARASAENRRRFGAGDDPIVTRAEWPTSAPSDAAALAALGGEAFELFPAGVDATWELRIDDDARLRAVGVPIVDGEAVGLLFVERSGEWRVGYTCMLCHSRIEADGKVRAGPANAQLRYGELLADAYPDHPLARQWRSWGRGRADVTDDQLDDPLRIPDLVGLDHARFFQQSGAVAASSPSALARRIEGVLARSPVSGPAAPALATALAAWLRAQPQPSPPDPTMPGARVFERRCARCHDGPALGGQHLVEARLVGTDDRAAKDGLRGTGSYRVPSLLGAGSRERFFHDGALGRLSDVLDPVRFESTFTGGALGPGAVRGHPWGATLPAAERAALVAFLSTSRW